MPLRRSHDTQASWKGACTRVGGPAARLQLEPHLLHRQPRAAHVVRHLGQAGHQCTVRAPQTRPHRKRKAQRSAAMQRAMATNSHVGGLVWALCEHFSVLAQKLHTRRRFRRDMLLPSHVLTSMFERASERQREGWCSGGGYREGGREGEREGGREGR